VRGGKNLAFSLHNYAGVPGTIICGWISAKFFKGRCAPANVIYMVLVLIGILVYWKAAPIAQSLAEIFGGDPAAIGRTRTGGVSSPASLAAFQNTL